MTDLVSFGARLLRARLWLSLSLLSRLALSVGSVPGVRMLPQRQKVDISVSAQFEITSCWLSTV